jgi:hypothetical protein
MASAPARGARKYPRRGQMMRHNNRADPKRAAQPGL